MIQLTQVTKSYNGAKAVDNVTLSIPAGQILGFLGPNGAGKTTTMRMITCYMPPTSGTITVDGKDTTEQSVHFPGHLLMDCSSRFFSCSVQPPRCCSTGRSSQIF